MGEIGTTLRVGEGKGDGLGRIDAKIRDLAEILQQYGKERTLSPGEVLFRQGSVSDGMYYLKWGRLGVYREEPGASYLLTEVAPEEMVGEIGSATGWPRTATVKAEEKSCVVHVSEADFHRAIEEAPALVADIVCTLGQRLTDADTARITLGRSYQQALNRVQALCTQKERLEELMRLREELARMIVHDLRNPLGLISSGVELLEEALIAETEQEYVTSVIRMMRRSVRWMQHLVDTLLDIARLEAGGMMLQRLPLDLSTLTEEVIAEEGPLAGKRGVALESRLPAGLPAVLADHDVLQRVLINLLDNALKFTPSGGQVWVEAQPGAEVVRVAVIDTGPGIPLEERERIFEKFTQGQGQVETRRGSGLGLAFCRMAVEAHGGRIWVEDGPEGRGSRFVFTLPQARM
jgi:signal transduction histidine kinase